MRQRTPQRTMALALFFSALSFFNFSRLQGSDCIRAIHIVTLLLTGIGIGVFISALKIWLTERQKNRDL